MASPELSRTATTPEDYMQVYRRVLAEPDRPVVLYWLGEAYDAQLAGFWSKLDFDTAKQAALAIIEENQAKVQGIKLSLLDADKESVTLTCLTASI